MLAFPGLILVLAVATLPTTPRLPEQQRAETAYRQGVAQFREGDFAAAAESFQKAYQQFPRPEFLVNEAQCHRALDDSMRAIELLERFLAIAPEHPSAPDVSETLRTLRAAALPKSDSPRAEPGLAPSPKVDVGAAPLLPPSGAPTASSALVGPASDYEVESGRRPSTRWWILAGVGTAAALTAGALLLAPNRTPSPPTIGEITVPSR